VGKAKVLTCSAQIGPGFTYKCETKLDRFAWDKYSNLLCPFVSDEAKSFIIFTASVNIVKLSIFVIDAQLITLIKSFMAQAHWQNIQMYGFVNQLNNRVKLSTNFG
jgi:hypothetical protein